MGYTHYWSDLELSKYPEELIDTFNQAYQDFLRAGVTIEGKHIDLYALFKRREIDEEMFDEHFHEWAKNYEEEPVLFCDDSGWAFCKTARKSYDVAVVLTLHLASVMTGKNYSSDGDVIYRIEHLEQYVKDNLDDSFQYDFKKLHELFAIWLNKCIAFSDEIQKVEDGKQYSWVSDLPDIDLEYIADQITKGNTTIYLNNGQVVVIRFE